ncbi:GET complex, subunit GET2 [Metarhizium rileyi]|uniref:GET complex, subunit GET2 n=1 Tax=Metarhizium rileyi (strain RCEF 4871) TaxID=1649241 RepID=A0A167EET9_METRR|nr:GET complex, subunit GET2 [Metarhizium rileyi RCEF 4871]
MTENAEAASASNDAAAAAAAQRASEQARLRRERREAKIKAGGAARLNKINGLGGRVAGDNDDEATPVAADTTSTREAATSRSKPQNHADPDEVDISQHFYTPQTTSRPTPSPPEPSISEAQLRQMMLGFDRPSNPNTPGSSTPSGMPSMDDDPLMKMMTQMMGQAGAGSPPFPGMPPMPGQAQQPAAPSAYHTTWRLIHALVALSLGLYLTLFTTFSGTKMEREAAALAHVQHTPADDDNERHKRIFFWIFATSEAVLLTTRVLLDKGRPPPPGILWTIVGFVPEPIRGYLSVGLKYSQIFTTVRTDILTCMFVLGACSWLRA